MSRNNTSAEMVAKKKHKAHGSILGPAKHSPAAAKAAPQREAQPGEHTPTGKGDTPKGQHPQNGSPHHDGKAREQSKGVREGIDRTTGKKRGTLFSAAPAARKPAAKRFAAVAPPAADALSGKTRGAAPHKGQNHQRRGPEGAAPAGGQHAGKKRKRYRGKSKRPDLSVRSICVCGYASVLSAVTACSCVGSWGRIARHSVAPLHHASRCVFGSDTLLTS